MGVGMGTKTVFVLVIFCFVQVSPSSSFHTTFRIKFSTRNSTTFLYAALYAGFNNCVTPIKN